MPGPIKRSTNPARADGDLEIRDGVSDFGRPLDREALRVPQGPNSGAAATFGRWPGDESDEEILAILEELS